MNTITIKERQYFSELKGTNPTPVNIAEMSFSDSFVHIHYLVSRITYYNALSRSIHHILECIPDALLDALLEFTITKFYPITHKPVP